MRKVALVIGSGDPTSGGGHTFVKTVLNGFLCVDYKEFDYEIIVIVHEDEFESLIPPHFPFSVIKLKKPIYRMSHFVRRILLRVDQSSPKAIIEGFDFVFYLGCEVLQTETPYGFVLWDLQHMTDPIFPEVGKFPVWNSRDKSSHLALRRSSLIITGTPIGKEQIVKYYGVDEKQIEIIPHPVKYSEYINSGKVSSNSPVKTFFYPAQFWAHKNHILLVKVARVLKDEGLENFQFILTGSDKGNKEYILESIRQAEVTDFFKVYGFVTEHELESIYAATDVLVYPSYSGPENLPPLEAIAKNLPVFISDYPGAREQLGDNASYFNPKNELELVALIKLIFEDARVFQHKFDQVERLLKTRNGNYFVTSLLSAISDKMIIRDTWK